MSQEPGDLDRLFMLSELNKAYATLGVLAFARGVHPLVAYAELCRVVGQLSIFGSERRPPAIPRYDHDDLAGIFYWVKRQVELLLAAIRDYEYEQRFFVGEGKTGTLFAIGDSVNFPVSATASNPSILAQILNLPALFK